MSDQVIEFAPWLTLALACMAFAIAVALGWSTWRTYRRVGRTRAAATALLDVHRARLDAMIMLAGDRAGTVSDSGEQLSTALAELRSDVDHLRWLLTRVPEAQASLRRQLLDTVLPTDG